LLFLFLCGPPTAVTAIPCIDNQQSPWLATCWYTNDTTCWLTLPSTFPVGQMPTYTLNGRTCQQWSKTGYAAYADLPNNTCTIRNSIIPWCFTTDPSHPLEYCFSTYDKCVYKPDGTNAQCTAGNNKADTCWYTNTPACLNPRAPSPNPLTNTNWPNLPFFMSPMSRTVSNRPCQRWNDSSPHTHSYTWISKILNVIPGYTGQYDNNCIILDFGWVPWCYTTDPLYPVEFCYNEQSDYGCMGVNDHCTTDPITGTCWDISSLKCWRDTAYFGQYKTQTISNHTCLPWNQTIYSNALGQNDLTLPAATQSINANYCRILYNYGYIVPSCVTNGTYGYPALEYCFNPTYGCTAQG